VTTKSTQSPAAPRPKEKPARPRRRPTPDQMYERKEPVREEHGGTIYAGKAPGDIDVEIKDVRPPNAAAEAAGIERLNSQPWIKGILRVHQWKPWRKGLRIVTEPAIQSLRDALNKTPAGMPWPEVLSALRPVARTVDELHARGLAHGRIRLEHLVQTSDETKLTYFGGLTPEHSADTTPPAAGAAPEAVTPVPNDEVQESSTVAPSDAALNDPATAHRAADRRALTVCALELAAGAAPLTDPDPQRELARRMGRFLDLSALPPAVQAVVSLGLGARYATCTEFVDRLAEAVGEPAVTEPDRPERRWPRFFAKTGAIALAPFLMIGSIGLLGSAPPAVSQVPAAGASRTEDLTRPNPKPGAIEDDRVGKLWNIYPLVQGEVQKNARDARAMDERLTAAVAAHHVRLSKMDGDLKAMADRLEAANLKELAASVRDLADRLKVIGKLAAEAATFNYVERQGRAFDEKLGAVTELIAATDRKLAAEMAAGFERVRNSLRDFQDAWAKEFKDANDRWQAGVAKVRLRVITFDLPAAAYEKFRASDPETREADVVRVLNQTIGKARKTDTVESLRFHPVSDLRALAHLYFLASYSKAKKSEPGAAVIRFECLVRDRSADDDQEGCRADGAQHIDVKPRDRYPFEEILLGN
jgi:hypothetical protein